MVTFCMRCKSSLPPSAMILIKDGKELPSPYYICPSCGKSAGTPKEAANTLDDIPQSGIVVIKDGMIEKKS